MIGNKTDFTAKDIEFVELMLKDAYAQPVFRTEIFNMLYRDAKDNGPVFMRKEVKYLLADKVHKKRAAALVNMLCSKIRE